MNLTNRICRTCRIKLDISQFHRRKKPNGDYGRHTECKACMNERHKRNVAYDPVYWQHYYEKAKAIRLPKQREYYERNKERILKYCKEHREINRSAYRDRALRYMYGISLADYENLVTKQNGLCAICKGPPGRAGRGNGKLHIDHSHTTGKLRGLLCHNCNLGIGNLQEDPIILKAALEYLASND